MKSPVPPQLRAFPKHQFLIDSNSATCCFLHIQKNNWNFHARRRRHSSQTMANMPDVFRDFLQSFQMDFEKMSWTVNKHTFHFMLHNHILIFRYWLKAVNRRPELSRKVRIYFIRQTGQYHRSEIVSFKHNMSFINLFMAYLTKL